ncbi:hypothetical protein [Flavobacterium sp.]|uniref:hypothetical protein n=1 Tax=Flavobacterium sp. TaxID=239 RepID=UPI00286CD730|nr:hypothetical protein [Flavobacterium sp.]
MKTFAIVFLSLFVSKSCQSKKDMVDKNDTVTAEVSETKPTEEIIKNDKTETQEKGTMVVYEAMSRGYFAKIVFQNDKLSVSKDRNNTEKGDPISITAAEASEINKLLKAVKPQTLPSLKWPTEKRFYDGAAHANLTIIQNGETFVGGGFDHGFPPAEIEKLVNKLVSIAEKK